MALERIRVDPDDPGPETLGRIASVLADGGVVAYPTETFYGLGANALDAVACERVWTLKGRPASKALPVILASVAQLHTVTEEERLPLVARRLADRFWPGPLTLIVPCRAGIAASVDGDTLAVRVSGLPLARAMAASLGGPITATSANPSGGSPAVDADEVVREFSASSSLALVVDGGVTPGGAPSTIVDVTTERPRLVREGKLRFEEVLAAVEASFS
jgi:L-threonylcarbamoyladenylate synthase